MKDNKFCVLGLVVLVACSSESTSRVTANQDAGGTSNVGASMGLGGASATPGNSSGGASLAAAGSSNGGAANSAGGLANDLGGASSTGGTSTAVGAGGTIAAGGTVSVGGAVSSGGLLGLGGTPTTGGAAIGGASTTGGTPATGGAPTTMGGKTATGGTATGGAPTMGGTPATGGNATGGNATGGNATGGNATGGNATGGTATGDNATGGNATGGNATGGNATGGTAAGGAMCTAPASPSAIQFVDPAAGTDDDVHGGAFGACAYKSLTYALTRATGQIALQAATYSATTETFPIVLTGSQQLLCKYTTATSAVIQGKGSDVANVQSTVSFRGTRNALDNCKVDGNGGTGYCVHITSSGSFSSSPHIITSSDIGNCGTAAITIRYANNVTITGSSIHNSQIGVSWLGPNTGGSMVNNTFKSNSISDIQCSIADPGVTGSGNTALGVLYCSQCGNCPF